MFEKFFDLLLIGDQSPEVFKAGVAFAVFGYILFVLINCFIDLVESICRYLYQHSLLAYKQRTGREKFPSLYEYISAGRKRRREPKNSPVGGDKIE